MNKQGFYFMGRGPVSKSLYLRALVVQSYFPSFQIRGDLSSKDGKGLADDVFYIQQALMSLRGFGSQNLVLNCGLSGAVLRFLSLRVARGFVSSSIDSGQKSANDKTVRHLVSHATRRLSTAGRSERGSASIVSHATRHLGTASRSKTGVASTMSPPTRRLFERPMEELLSILGQLSCDVELGSDCLRIESGGWRPVGDVVTVSMNRSSQFASALLLNSWLLPFDFYMSIEGSPVSSSYFGMTVSFLRSLGMQIISKDRAHKEYYIPKGQRLSKKFYDLEQDMDCLFALSAITVGGGGVCFTDWPQSSLQPDFVFPNILKQMGFHLEYSHQCLKICKGPVVHPITYNLRESPDLFPILSVLCALSEGESYLYGAPHLCYKESHRLEKMGELLTKAGKEVQVLEDGLKVSGSRLSRKVEPFVFDPAGDHRIAMSAGLLKKVGLPIRILTPEVVNKSFPDFWSITNIDPLK